MPDLLDLDHFACHRRSMRTNPDRSVWIVGAATIAVGIGSVMPWVSARWAPGRMTILGTDGDGRVTIMAATAAVIAIAVATRNRSTHQLLPALGLLASVLVAATAIYDTVTIRHLIAGSRPNRTGSLTVNVGTGLWIVDVGAVVLLVGAWLAVRETTARQNSSDFESLLQRSTSDMVVSRTVVVMMPLQRESAEVSAERNSASPGG